MSDAAWRRLLEAGVPCGAIRPPPHGMARHALRESVAEVIEARDRRSSTELGCLLAWLSAFRKRWPASFAATLGEAGERGVAILRAELDEDPGRYLKQRRIATANLTALLG